MSSPIFSGENLLSYFELGVQHLDAIASFLNLTSRTLLPAEQTDCQFDVALGRRTAAKHYNRLIARGCGLFRASDSSSLVHRPKLDIVGFSIEGRIYPESEEVER